MTPKEYLGAWGTLIHEKNLKSKISCQTPFKLLNLCCNELKLITYLAASVFVPSAFGENIPIAEFGMISTETAYWDIKENSQILMRTCCSTLLYALKAISKKEGSERPMRMLVFSFSKSNQNYHNGVLTNQRITF